MNISALQTLLTDYSLESLLLIIVMLAVGVKVVSDLWDYFYGKVKSYFRTQNEEREKDESVIRSIDSIGKEVSELKSLIQEQQQMMRDLQEQNDITIERLQENERSYIIDKHHHFCYEVGAIDDMNLASLERRYVYYKAHKGNTFVDGLMSELRALPRMTPGANKANVINP